MIDCNNEKNLNLMDVFPSLLKHEIINCNFVTLNLNNFINFPKNQLFYHKLTACHNFESFFSSTKLLSARVYNFHSPSSALLSALFIYFTIHSLLTQLYVAFHSLTTKLYVNYTQKPSRMNKITLKCTIIPHVNNSVCFNFNFNLFCTFLVCCLCWLVML